MNMHNLEMPFGSVRIESLASSEENWLAARWMQACSCFHDTAIAREVRTNTFCAVGRCTLTHKHRWLYIQVNVRSQVTAMYRQATTMKKTMPVDRGRSHEDKRHLLRRKRHLIASHLLLTDKTLVDMKLHYVINNEIITCIKVSVWL